MVVLFCKNCGGQVEEGASFCPKCGTSISNRPVTSNLTEYSTESSNEQDVDSTRTLGIFSIIMGVFFPIIGFICGVIGISRADSLIRQGCRDKSVMSSRNLAIIGLIISIIAIVIWLIV